MGVDVRAAESAGQPGQWGPHCGPPDVLLRVARTLVGSGDADELVQETLVRAWLLTILRNTNMNMHRRRRPASVDDVASLAGARPAFGIDSPVNAPHMAYVC